MSFSKTFANTDGVKPRYSELIRAVQLAKKLAISKATLYRWQSDPTLDFPKPIRLGPKVVAWRVAEVDEFISRRAGG